MARTLILYIYVLLLFAKFDCEVYQDRPKIKTSDGDLILEPAFDKSIYLRPNGPKSSIYVGEVNILSVKSGPNSIQYQEAPNNNFQESLLNGPNGILKRLERLESKTLPVPDDLFLNISTLWRRVNNLNRKVNSLQAIINNRDKDECESQPCQHGGTCLNLINGYHCLCPSNWEGNDCDVDVNECRNFAGTDLGCQNGAACINKPGYYECLCRSGWFGLHCTRKAKDCSGGDFEMCGHGTCLKVDTGEGVACMCHQGWTTNGTGVTCLTDVNECDSQQGGRCSINPKVECINLPGSFRCGQCPHGYEGDGYTCADIDECITIPNGGCSPMVACHNTIGSRICGPCPSGYQGDGVTCSWKGSCQINHGGCHQSAQCVDNLGRSQCICPDGMDGDGIGLHGCYISVGNNYTRSCENYPCGIHGQCRELQTGYTCICQRGYGGPHCDGAINLCAINPCRNGGLCRQDDSTTTGFRCECTAQYSGPLCQVLSRTCGGVLDNEEGNIVYPLTNTTYLHNSRCAWVIHTVPSKVINVTFSKFNIEEGNADCPYDFLQIHDGPSSASQLVGRFCGNTLPKGGNIVSNHNNLYFWFRSDSTVTKEGFALHWTSIDPVCGGNVDARSHGHISSPGSPGKYPPNRDCFWILSAPLGKKIQLLFFALDIESHTNCSFDYLAIYEGSKQTDPLLNRYCNSDLPAPLLSAGSVILIHFHSDAYGAGYGFQLTYAPVPGVPGCGGYFTNEKGELSSPSYNGTYLSNILCEYNIKTSQGSKIRIDFREFHLEKSVNCRFDYLKIYDGPSEESPLVGKFCGTIYPKFYVSSSNTLYFIFRSDYSVSGEGFKISYNALCQQTLYADSGVIQSPGYPFSYPLNKMCEYFISTSPGKAIRLTFQDFDIEDNRNYNCQYDNVEIRDGTDVNSTLLGKFCGGSEHTPPVQISTHNHMYMRFNSDMSVSGRGFFANYTTFATECGGIYRETTGLINLPSGDSSTYKNDQSCIWILMAPQGMHIKLTWHRFELESMPSCDSDYLELIELDENNSNFTLGKFCGTKTPPAFTSSTNRLMMRFLSDRSVRSAGFSVSYTFLDEKSHCGGNYFRSHGFIYSPGWPKRYETNRDCTWIITVPAGQQIRLNITQFDLERAIRGKCNHGDFLEVRNGVTVNSPLIGQYCGKFQTRIITSIANTLHIHFHSDYYLTGNGFKLEWDGSVIGCGGTLTSSSGSISSPNYPDNYNENTECFYKIVTSLGSRIRLTFIDLELERTANCRDDSIEIFDGRDFDATSLGKYCYMSPGLSNIETTSNYAFIKFRSDAYIAAKGFLLNYLTICNNNLTGSYGVIESPDYPNNYPQSLDCLWNISVSKGNRINITFVQFDIFKSYRHYLPTPFSPRFHSHFAGNTRITSGFCYNDYLQWREITETKYSDKFCGTTSPPKITTKGNSVQIKFATGTFGSTTGFRLEWKRYGCGGHIRKSFGSISTHSSTIFSEELVCEWLIETNAGNSVSLVITDIFLKESQNCSMDVIEIYNGDSSDSPLLSKICNKQISTVQSTSNIMFIKYTKHSSLIGAYFTSNFISSKATCGGNIISVSGYIYSKNYPKNYDNNLDCKWYIAVPVNHRIELNFMDFDLYSMFDTDCGDSIKIFDNSFLSILNYNYTSIICPKSKINQITTNRNRIMLQFTSDKFGNAKGFKANFSVTCGAFINALNDGIISNEHYIGGSNKSCTWTIRAAQVDQKISLTITHIFLPTLVESNSNRSCGSSYLRVYNGDDINAPLIDEYCGKKAPPMIVSQGSVITVFLGSYMNYTIGYFTAHYSPLSEACGGELTSEEGTLASPNYPRSYPNSANCEWTLITSPGNKVYVVFEKFDVEYSEQCNEDYLEIREDNGGGNLLGVYCGTEIPTNTTIASKLYIKFHSSNKNNGKGFVLQYGFLHGNELINKESGEITSPLYPHLYLGTGIYSWRIQSKGPEDMSISIDELEIPSFGNVCNNYLSIYDGYDDTAPLLSKLCGKLMNPVEVIRTSSNMAFIQLLLDNSNTGTQFHLKWEKANVDAENLKDKEVFNCGSNYTELLLPGNFSIFETPHYPENYDNDLNCKWTFQATYGRRLKLNFLEFELEETSRCFADSVSIYSADVIGEWKQVKDKVCETQLALLETNSSKYLKVELKTDSSVNRKGFKGKVSSVCGGLITDLSGEIGPTWDDTHIGSVINYQMKCEWVIKVRPGRLIELEFKHFNISNNDNCATSVTLKNGDSKEAPVLGGGKFCGFSHENRGQLITSSNNLYIYYVTDLDRYSTRVFQNFKIRYEEQNVECGTTSKLDTDQHWEVFSSLNYPNPPVPFSECVWIFSAPPGEILRVDFTDRFDLDNVDGCVNEVVELYDGSSDSAPSLGRFCSEIPQTIKTKSNVLYVKYLTQISEPRNGFKANVSIDICGGTIIAENGEIKSPGYPHMINVPYNTVCEWRIKGKPTNVFSITPQDIDLPESVSPCAIKVTIEENMPGFNTATLLKQFCETEAIQNSIQTSTNEIKITFHSGQPSDWPRGVQSRGFRLTYTSSRPSCGGDVKTPEGFITSPGYPLDTAIRFCHWNIMVPDDTRRIRLELIDTNAAKHTIKIYDGNSFQSLIQSIPGTDYNPSTRFYESSGNKLLLFLRLNPLVSGHRFKAKFSSNQAALCGGNINVIIRELTSPNLERSFSCEWHYNSRVGTGNIEYNTISVTATVNSSVTNSRCRHADPKLNIKAFVLKHGLSFYRDLCGSVQTTFRIPSSAIDIKATKNRGDSLYFHLEFKPQPCGGLINVSEDPVNILNIPSNANDTLDCAWIVTMPFNSRMQLKMEGSFQYECDEEYINIGQGFSQYSATIGDYCKGKTLDVPLLTNFRNLYIQYHIKATNTSNIKLMAQTVISQCGGQLSSYQSVFSSPNYPKSYEPNQECAWIITAGIGNRVSLNFINRFVVEETPNCTKDAVIIYDWKEDTFTEIARLCGRQLTGPYNSTYNKMKVVLRTDNQTNLDGFKAQYSTICGGSYLATNKKQILLSPGFPSGYPSMANCKYEISAPGDNKVFIEFLEFDLEGTYPTCQFDNVTIEGADREGYNYLLETHCGTDIPSAIRNYNKVYISFMSDRFVQKRGFKLSFQIYECGGQVTEPTVLSSHNGDGVYDNNLNCTWFIQAPLNKLIVFKFLYIDLEMNVECYNDFVAVFDGPLVNDSNRLALLCGHNLNSSTIVRSHENKALLQFVTDQSYGFKGFKVEVSFTYGDSVGCGGQLDLATLSSTKTLKSPLIGTNVVYENYLDCHWSITSPSDTVLKLEFVAFHISSCLNVNQTALGFDKCDCDFVEIRDGINPDSLIIGTYCGHTLPPLLYSSGNLMSVRLSTDGELTSSGFEARLSFQPNACGQSRFTISDKVTRIKSPGYESGTVRLGLRCVYYFKASSQDSTVRISILNLDIQPPYDQNGNKVCGRDKLIIATNRHTGNISVGQNYILNHGADSFISSNYFYDVEDQNLPRRLEYCGSVKSSDVYVTGSVTLTLITSAESDSKPHKGVDFEVASVGFCGKNYTGTQGKIQTIYSYKYYDETYVTSPESKDCYTLITAPDNNTISAYFISVNPSYWNDDVYLDIFDGKDTSSRKIITINKDYDTVMPLFSTGRYILMHNRGKGDEHVQYEMVYVTTDKARGCGGKLTIELGRVTSPMYPDIYRQDSKCEWELETPIGTHLKLHFEAFDLGRSCDQNYLQLVDSKGIVISSYCTDKPADYTSPDNFVKIVFHTTKNNGGTGWTADFVGII